MSKRERALRFALTYLCEKHGTVLAGVTASGALTTERTASVAVAQLDEALQWAASVMAARFPHGWKEDAP